ncbi:MAG: hypothetical protein LBC11_01800 [Puniceicoccales bacterium]|jgi:hypothetical protein|nr:hypothetical protein [Puniceicoccales bacterium]
MSNDSKDNLSLDPLQSPEAPEMSPGQPGPVGRHKLNLAHDELESNQQPSLSKHQQVLQEKFGLSERVCASFKTESEGMKTFVRNLGDGKFDPGLIKTFLLWLSSKFGGRKYEAAVRQFRIETAATKSQEIFKSGDFQNDLADAIRNCDSKELLQAIQAAYDMLAGDPGARRDFFINKLLIPFSGKVCAKMSKGKIDVKNPLEICKNFSVVNQFCLDNKIECLQKEKPQVIFNLEGVKIPLGNLVIKVMYRIITADTDGEREQLEKDLSEIKKLRLTAKEESNTHLSLFYAFKDSFSQILQCFGENQDESLSDFKTFEDGLGKISNEITEKCQGGQAKDEDWGKLFTQKVREFLSEKPKLMWAALGMNKAMPTFFDSFFLAFINFRGDSEDKINLFRSISLQTMGKVMEGNLSLSDEQVQLLCRGVDLANLLRDKEKNKDTIDMVLKFIQENLSKISFEDIMPAHISLATCQRLLQFVNQEIKQEQGKYNQALVNFITEGIEQRTASKP